MANIRENQCFSKHSAILIMPSIDTRQGMIIDGSMDPFSTIHPSPGRSGEVKYPKKPSKTDQVTLVPNQFGLPDTVSSEIKIYQLFEDNKVITQGSFEVKFK